MKITKSQFGFTAVHLLLILVLFGIVGFTGWKVYDAGKSAKPVELSTAALVVKKEESKIPDGWAEYKIDELGFKFAYPKNWKIKKTTNPQNMSPVAKDLPYIELSSDDFQEDPEAKAYGGTKTGAIYNISAYRTDKKTFDQIPDGGALSRYDLKDVLVDGTPAIDYYQNYEGPPIHALVFIHNSLNVSFTYRYKEKPGSSYDQKYMEIRKQIIDTIKFL